MYEEMELWLEVTLLDCDDSDDCDDGTSPSSLICECIVKRLLLLGLVVLTDVA